MEQSAASIIEKRALLTPERTALVEWESGRRFDYRSLDERSNRLSRALLDMGVKKGDRVSILAPNRICHVDLFFAAAKTGAVIAPLNWRLAAPELDYMVNDAKPKALLFSEEHSGIAEDLCASAGIDRRIDLNSYEAMLDSHSQKPLEPADISSEDPHTVFYTSGTTGRPKGAVLPHRMIVWNSFNTIISWGLTQDDSAPVFTPMFHSGGFNIFLVPLLHVGGKVILCGSFDPEEALAMIEKERLSVVFMVPTMFRMIADLPGFKSADLGSVKFFVSGGAPCPIELIRRYQSRGFVFKQGFGMTEVGVNAFSMTAKESVQKAGSVGKPIFHSSMKIVDDSGSEVGSDEVGELLIAGPHLFSGYLGKPDETKAAFLGRWFRTGDLARKDADGFYWIAGRKKEMFISGGENVYLAEVETALTSHPAVSDAAVLAIPDERWGEVGRAIVVLSKEKGAINAADILQFLKGRLAGYKIPKEVVFAESLPRNSYGKLMRKELKDRFG